MPHRPAIVYLSKFPPSPSGIGLYASFVADALAAHRVVERLMAPANAAESQRLSSAIAGWRQGRRLGRGTRAVQVELSGRALYEFYACVGFVSRRGHPPLAVTCHHAPSVVGLPMLFTAMDRRGLRRIGAGLSRTIGEALVRRLMKRVGVAFALTREEAEALSDAYGRPFIAIPHIVPQLATDKKSVAFLPAYHGDPVLLRSIVACLDRWAPTDWRIRVGPCSPTAAEALADLAATGRVQFTGYVDETELLALSATHAWWCEPPARLSRGEVMPRAAHSIGP